jgi:hypothetical protein
MRTSLEEAQMKARWFWITLLSLSIAWSAEAQKKKKPDPKPPEPPKRVCQDGNPAAEDGSCPEDFIRTCQDGNPAFEDGSCPEDAPKINYQEIPIEVKSNVELAAITIDDLDVGQAPFKGTSRISEGSHVFSVIFPGFNIVSEDIEVNADLSRKGITKVVTLEPINEKAKGALSTPKGIEKFIVSGLTVDGYLEYQQAKKIRNGGVVALSASLLFFGGFTAMKITFENQDNPLIATALTFGVVSAIVGAPATVYGQYKLKKSATKLRDEDFRRKPPAPPEPPDEPESKPASAPSTAPTSAPTVPTSPTTPPTKPPTKP